MAKVQYDRLVKVTEGLYSSAVKAGRNHRQASEQSTAFLAEMFKAQEVKANDFDLGRLFTEVFGWHHFQAARSSNGLAHEVFEAAGAVSTAAFFNISGQIAYSAVLDAYQNEEFQFSKLIPEKQTPYNGEKIPGITPIGNETLVVNEGEPFPKVGVSETYIEVAQPQKRGVSIDVTREAIFFDRTGVLLERCANVGWGLGADDENRAIDCLIDEGTTATDALTGSRYRWRGTSISTYGNNSGSHSWDNLEASNALVSYVQLDAAEQLFNTITDPDTAEPIDLEPTHLVVTKQLEQTAFHILNSLMIRRHLGGYATTGNLVESEVNNPYKSKYQLLSTKRLALRLATDTDWFLCNFKAWARMVNWPLQVKQAQTNSYMEYERDIVASYRADARSNYSTLEPRLSVKSTA